MLESWKNMNEFFADSQVVQLLTCYHKYNNTQLAESACKASSFQKWDLRPPLCILANPISDFFFTFQTEGFWLISKIYIN